MAGGEQARGQKFRSEVTGPRGHGQDFGFHSFETR